MASTRSTEKKPLILVFGDEATGKSSVIDLLINDSSLGLAHGFPDHKPNTRFSKHEWQLEGKECMLVDTPPLADKFKSSFNDFFRENSQKHNVAGIIFLHPEGRTFLSHTHTYELARSAADYLKVPFIFGLTFTDEDPDMYAFYNQNKEHYHKMGWIFDKVVPICTRSVIATREIDKEYFSERRKLSRENLIAAIKETALLDHRAAPIPNKSIFRDSVSKTKSFNIFSEANRKEESLRSWWPFKKLF